MSSFSPQTNNLITQEIACYNVIHWKLFFLNLIQMKKKKEENDETGFRNFQKIASIGCHGKVKTILKS